MTAEPETAPAIPAEPERLPVTAWPGPGALMDEHPEWGYLAEPYAPASLTIIDPDLWQACVGSAEREPAPLPTRRRGPMSGAAEDVTGADDKSGPQQCVESRTGPGHPEDATHDETCCMNGVVPSAGPHPDCPGRPSPTAAASAEDQAQDAADAHQRDSEATLARWGTARCFPCSRDKCSECERGTCGCAHASASGVAAITAEHDGEVMPDEPVSEPDHGRGAAQVTPPRPSLSDHAPDTNGDERREGPGRRATVDELLGIDPDWTGGVDVDEFVRRQRERGDPDALSHLVTEHLSRNPRYQAALRDAEAVSWDEPGVSAERMIAIAAGHAEEFNAIPDLPPPVEPPPLTAPGSGQAAPRPDDPREEPGRGARDQPWAHGGPFLTLCCDDVPPQALHSHVHAPGCDNALCHGCVPRPDVPPEQMIAEEADRRFRLPPKDGPDVHAGFWSPRDPAAGERAGDTAVMAPVAEPVPAWRSLLSLPLPRRKPPKPEHKPRHASHGEQEPRT